MRVVCHYTGCCWCRRFSKHLTIVPAMWTCKQRLLCVLSWYCASVCCESRSCAIPLIRNVCLMDKDAAFLLSSLFYYVVRFNENKKQKIGLVWLLRLHRTHSLCLRLPSDQPEAIIGCYGPWVKVVPTQFCTDRPKYKILPMPLSCSSKSPISNQPVYVYMSSSKSVEVY